MPLFVQRAVLQGAQRNMSSPVYCGFDADQTGDLMAARMMARYPTVQRLRPLLHDWNDTLRSQA